MNDTGSSYARSPNALPDHERFHAEGLSLALGMSNNLPGLAASRTGSILASEISGCTECAGHAMSLLAPVQLQALCNAIIAKGKWSLLKR
jgi:hypothetical protein